MEVSDVRRRLRAAIDQARRDAAQRRELGDAAARDYEMFLADVAVPTFQTLANALAAEGYRFQVFTPADSVRLASERSNDDFLELTLDKDQNPPVLLIRTSHGRGRRQVTSERPVSESSAIPSLTTSDVLQFVLDEIAPFVDR